MMFGKKVTTLEKIPQIIGLRLLPEYNQTTYWVVIPPSEQRLVYNFRGAYGYEDDQDFLVQVPWVLMGVVVTNGDRFKTTYVSTIMAFNGLPTTDYETTKVFNFGFPNTHTSGEVCAGGASVEINVDTSLHQALILGINSYWEARFNRDLNHFSNIERDLQRWEDTPEAFHEQRLNIAELNGKDYSLRQFLDRHVHTLYISPRSIFSTDLFTQGSALKYAGVGIPPLVRTNN